MNDYLVHSTAANGHIRCLAAVTTNLVNEARNRHDLYPVASAALGRLMTGALLMASAEFKGDERINLKLDGDGPLGVVFADAKVGEVRGYVHNPHVQLPANSLGKIDVAGGVGNGNLYVIKDLKLKEPYTSSIPLVSGEIAEDLTYYYAKSEQKPSSFGLGVLIDTDGSIIVAGGFLIQVMPGATEEELGAIENKLSLLKGVTDLILDLKTPEEIVNWLVGDLNPQILKKQPLNYKCNCSKEKYLSSLITLGKEQLEDLTKEENIQLVCSFCNEKYIFTSEELKEITKKI
ncbi:molecular chaperone Hsp33 [Anaerobranca californiensis DSM 14826]|jgi:molecular chaperone Hsp33|uniref:33 kDa chaperonin n=1 Tax=Anaerobranca californiensis DSM 14826 TaxID=1120989 RepID=A0A1M6PYN2_9FIRM|nr:Hsp33 family molecular chaperone HslO [Anaerobranca californiensis]SHK13095.1 molecular chaperone Hsp33 [Anaerobranca californiensis DSM 14826]